MSVTGRLERRGDVLGPGAGRLTATLPGCALPVFTYSPRSEARGCLILFSGQHRDARGLRDKAIRVAEVTGLNVFAPLMTKEEFPVWRYNRAGVIRRKRIQPRKYWTAPLLQSLVHWTREWMARTDLPTYLFGHSAGGQLLSRVWAYSPLTGVERVVFCSPSVYVAPTVAHPVPFGYRGLGDHRTLEQHIRAYLSAPITIYLGKQDTGPYQLSQSEQAMSQGISRLHRGRRIFRLARRLAERQKWIFNWGLVEAPEVGHSVEGMLEAPECLDALQLSPGTGHKDQARHE